MKALFLLGTLCSLTCLSSCGSSPSSGGSGQVTRSIQNTASTVGIVRNLQSIFRGF